MKDKINKRILVVMLVVWCVVWARGLFKDIKENYRETADLFGKSQEHKWEHVFGPDLYEYLSAAKKIIPDYEQVTFLHNLDAYRRSRVRYFLFPRHIESDAKFIMVYHYPFLKNKDQQVIFKQNEDSYIIKE